jgi:hypothetical protein
MIQLLSSYPETDVKDSALKKAKGHLWYLSETNVGLAFLDERISQADKAKMFQSLEKPERKKELKRLEGKSLNFAGKELSDFVTSRTKTFFALFGITDAEKYCSNELRIFINALKVVNDTAERGIALIKKFNESVRDEQQKQFLLRIVEHHRKAVTKRTKTDIAAYKLN